MMELWPFTNFHDLNLDWLISKWKKLEDNLDDIHESMNAAAESAETAQTQATNASISAENAAESASEAAADVARAMQAVAEIGQYYNALPWSGRTVVLITDSYGTYVGTGGDVLTKMLTDGLNPANYKVIANSGSAFTYHSGNNWVASFQTLMTSNMYAQPSEVTDVIVLGGSNEENNYNSVLNAIKAFNTKVEEVYPNAQVHIGFTAAGRYQSKVLNFKNTYRAYLNAASNLNIHYLTNVEYVLKQKSLVRSDLVHPTPEGVDQLVDAVLEALGQGHCTVYKEFGAGVSTPDSTVFTIDNVWGGNNALLWIQHNNVAELQWTRGSSPRISFVSSQDFSSTSWSNREIMVLSDTLIIGTPDVNQPSRSCLASFHKPDGTTILHRVIWRFNADGNISLTFGGTADLNPVNWIDLVEYPDGIWTLDNK